MLTVHVRVNDSATGRPTPVRVRFLDSAGVYRPPLGRLAEFATGPGEDVGGSVRLGAGRFAYIDGSCEVPLPAGRITVEVHKGPEYLPVCEEPVLGPGKISLRLAVERWIDLRPQGWYSGDCRAHELSPHAALLEGAAEDLAVVNLLARRRPARGDRPAALVNLLAFSGTRAALDGPPAVVVNTCNTHPVLGTVALLHCHRPVYPLRFGAPDRADDWSVSDWCDQCHRKKGLVLWPDEPRLTAECPQGEALAALLLGKIDGFEVSRFPDPEPRVLADWYRLLDCGQRLPLAGGSGKDSNSTALGCVRTYARLGPGQEFSPATWFEAVRAGRTFVTNGPLLSLAADGRGPGAVLSPATGRPVHVQAEARSAVPFDQLEVLHNGTVVAAREASGNRRSAAIETELSVSEGGWLAARCWGGGPPGGGEGQCVYAHTSPVYFEVEGRPVRPDAATAAPLLDVLDRALAWVAAEARCEDDRQRARLAEALTSGRRELERRVRPGG